MQSQSKLGHSVYRLTACSIAIGLALILSYVEALIPLNIGVPGVKLGLPNLVTICLLYKLGKREAWTVSIIRVILAGLLFSGLFATLYSLAGAILSLIVMSALKDSGRFSLLGVSLGGAVFHNIGQIITASLVIQDIGIFYYLPVLIISAAISGTLIGILGIIIINRIQKL